MLNTNLIKHFEDKINFILDSANTMMKLGELQTNERLIIEKHINFEYAALLNTLVLKHKTNNNNYQTLLHFISISRVFDKLISLDKEYHLTQDSKETLENTIILRRIFDLIKFGQHAREINNLLTPEEMSIKIKNNFKHIAPILLLHVNNKDNYEAQNQFNPLKRASLKSTFTKTRENFKEYIKELDIVLNMQTTHTNYLMNELCCYSEELIEAVILELAPKYNNYYTPGGIFSYFMLSTELFENLLKNSKQIKGLVDFLQDEKSCDKHHEQIIKLNTETQLNIIKEISCRTELTGYTLHYLCLLIQKKLTPEIYKSLSKIKYENLLLTETQIFNIQNMLGTSLQYNLYMFLACINSPITKKIMPPINLSIFRWVDSPLNKSDYLKHYWSQLDLKDKDDSMTDYICDVTGTCKDQSSLGRLILTDANDEQTHGWIIDLILSTPELQLNKDSHILKHNENIDKLYFKDITSERKRKFNDMIDTLIERGESKQISNNIEIAD
jgi:hypothetical protein